MTRPDLTTGRTIVPNELAISFHNALEGLSPPEQAKKVMDRLPNVVKELLHEAMKPGMSATGQELWAYDAAVVLKAYDMLLVLSTEAWRQREAIKSYLAGQIDRGSLRDISNSWNGDKKREEDEHASREG